MTVTLASPKGPWVGTTGNPVTLTNADLRRADAALVSQAGISSGLSVSVDGSDVVTVTAGNAIISGEDAVTGTGVYRAGIGSAVTGNLEARDATNGRIDLVVIRQYDPSVVGAHTLYTSAIEVIKGTPSATPGVPTRPSMALELARITVPASGGGTATVNLSNRVSAAAVGISTGWVNFLPNVYAAASPTTPVGGVTRGVCKYRRQGGLIIAQADVAVSSSVTSPLIDLPVQALERQFTIGTSALWGATTPASQTGAAYMFTGGDKLVASVRYTSGYNDAVSGNAIRYHVAYEPLVG